MKRCLLLALALLLLGATSASAQSWPLPGYVHGDDRNAPDPTMVVRTDVTNKYAIYTTHNTTRYSTDRTYIQPRQQTMPVQQWWRDVNGSGDPWAPDVARRTFYGATRYLMYYSISNFGTNNSAIGLAWSNSGTPNTWTDLGAVVRSGGADPYNAIDPQLFVDKSVSPHKWYLYFGSWFGGLYVLPLDPATGKAPAGATAKLVMRRVHDGNPAVEAPFVFAKGGYYYMFMSYGRCCVGINEVDYDVRVARATSPLGPFRDRSGRAVLDSANPGVPPQIYGSKDWSRGPGHPAVYWDPNDSHWLLTYTYRNVCCPNGEDRFFGINWLDWDSGGWPYVK